MAAVRDPAFWHRFSVAVHLEEGTASTRDPQTAELKTRSTSSSEISTKLKKSDSWLEQQKAKDRRSRLIVFSSCSAMIGVVVAIAIVIWLGIKNGWFRVKS